MPEYAIALNTMLNIVHYDTGIENRLTAFNRLQANDKQLLEKDLCYSYDGHEIQRIYVGL